MKTKVAFAAALILAIAAAIGAKQVIDSYRSQVNEERVEMAFAETNLRAGETLVQNKVRIDRISGKTARAGDIPLWRLSQLLGTKLVRDVPAGNVLNEEDFFKPMDQIPFTGEVALRFRAITIPVDQVTGVAGLIKPHDRVDVLATIAYPSNAPSGNRNVLETLTVLENITVLAIDNRTAQYDTLPDRFRKEGRSGYTSVTLSVTPQEARILKLAQAMSQGMLTLVLRNPADDSSDVQRTSADTLWDAINKASEGRGRKTEPSDTDTVKDEKQTLKEEK